MKKSRTLNQQETIVDETSLLWPITGEDGSDRSLRIGDEGTLLDRGCSEEGNRKIEFSFQLSQDLPSTFQTKQTNFEVSVSYFIETNLTFREIFQSEAEQLEEIREGGMHSSVAPVTTHQCLSDTSLLRQTLNIIVLRSLDLRDEPQVEEEVRLEKEKVLTTTKSGLCFFFKYMRFRCQCCCCCCCRSHSSKSSSSVQVQDSTEMCLKSSDESTKGEETHDNLEKVICVLQLEKTGYVPGEDINVAAEVRNLSRKLIRATYVAMQQIVELRFKANNECKSGCTLQQEQEVRRELKDIFRVSGGVVRMGDTAYYHDIIHIPPLPPTFQPTDQMVGISYLVTIIRKAKNLRLSQHVGSDHIRFHEHGASGNDSANTRQMGVIFEREDSLQFELSQPIIIGTTPFSDSQSPWATLQQTNFRRSNSDAKNLRSSIGSGITQRPNGTPERTTNTEQNTVKMLRKQKDDIKQTIVSLRPSDDPPKSPPRFRRLINERVQENHLHNYWPAGFSGFLLSEPSA